MGVSQGSNPGGTTTVLFCPKITHVDKPNMHNVEYSQSALNSHQVLYSNASLSLRIQIIVRSHASCFQIKFRWHCRHVVCKAGPWGYGGGGGGWCIGVCPNVNVSVQCVNRVSVEPSNRHSGWVFHPCVIHTLTPPITHTYKHAIIFCYLYTLRAHSHFIYNINPAMIKHAEIRQEQWLETPLFSRGLWPSPNTPYQIIKLKFIWSTQAPLLPMLT